jgi:NADPH:quinone reductase-like Zn-dependent oxidoreductase
VKTIAVASDDQKLEKCKELGAFETINYKKTPEFGKMVLEMTNGKGVNVI